MKGSIRNMIGKVLKNRYKILEQFDEGGMAILYKALDVKSGQVVVVKTLRKNRLTNDMGDYVRFKREAAIVRNLSHPNIVKIYDASEHEGIPYIVMEQMDGTPLSRILLQITRFEEKYALNIIKQIAIALDYVNEMGIVHRDIKPGNIFLIQKGDSTIVKLLDFGVAHILELSEFKKEKEVIGTFGYMSPEASGILDKDIDERSDLYSLGIILYRMLTGELPFKEKELGKLMHQQVAYVPQKPSKLNIDVSVAADAICMRLLMKEPNMRYQSAKSLINDIRINERGEQLFVLSEDKDNIRKYDMQNTDKPVISDSILDTVLKGLEDIPEKAIELLCTCAAIGMEFNMSLLLKLTDIEPEEVFSILDKAKAHQILNDISDISEEALQKALQAAKYTFTHHKVREAFYCKLSEEERREKHLRIAEILEKMMDYNSGIDINTLANYYIESGNHAKAIQFGLLAADKAKSLHKNKEAISYYERVKLILESGRHKHESQWLGLCQSLIELYIIVGRNDEAITLAEQLSDIFEKDFEKAKLFKQKGIAYFKMGNWAKSEENLTRALRLLDENMTGDKLKSSLKISTEFIKYRLNSMLKLRINKRKNIEKKPVFKEIISIYEALGWVYILSDTYKLIYVILKIFNLARGKLNLSKDRVLSSGAFWGMFLNINKINNIIKYQEKQLAITADLGDELGVAKNMQLSGFMSFFAGNSINALEYLKEAEKGFQRIGDLWELGMVYNGLADIYFYSADYAKCIDSADRYLEISMQIKNSFGICGAKQHVACCMLETGNYTKAEEMLRHIIKISEELNVWSVYCTAFMYLGALEAERSNFNTAVEYLEMAKKINEKNNFFKQYSVILYSYIAEAYIKKFIYKVTEEEYTLTKKDRVQLYWLCKEAIIKTKNWNQNHGQALRAAAQYYNLIGQYSKSERYFKLALEENENNNRLFELAKTYHEMGSYYSHIGDGQAAAKCWYAAYELFGKIGSVAYIEQCMKLLGLVRNPDEALSSVSTNTTKNRLAYERRINTVAATSRYISSILDIDQLLVKIMDSAIELVGAERGVLFLYPEMGSHRLEVKVQRNMSIEASNEEMFTGSQSIIQSIEISKKSTIINDALADERFAAQASVAMKKIRSVICSPIMNRGNMLGIIYLDSSLLSGLFCKEDLKILDLIANQAGVSIENARLYRKMEIYSIELKESRDKTAKLNQTLEQRVRQRTIQLNGLNRELKEKNTLLESMNEDLKEYASAIEELSITRERNRVAIEVHDTLGHSLTLMLTLLEGAKLSCTKDIEDTKRRLEEAIEIARNGMGEIRRSISGLLPQRLEENNLIEALERLISEYQSLGVNVEMSVDDINIQFSSDICDTIYKICQEALTNSVRHGKATDISIILRSSEGVMKLYIFDNGIGCEEIKEDFGLYGMKHRIEMLGGNITFNTSSDLGFNIHAEIPISADRRSI